MNGILIVDKPADWTSHDVVAKLRGVFRQKRIGHGGTLDPMATGVLPVFIGRATRAVEFLENSEKEYIAGLRLGVVTDTQDITGSIITSCEVSVTREKLLEVIDGFKGAQKQIPPMYSAVKIGGKKLYEIARKGGTVERPARDIFIRELEFLRSGEGNEFMIRAVCSKGTYIRTLCHDIGQKLGCGGTMSSLRRTSAGVYTLSQAYTLDEIISAAGSAAVAEMLLPVDSIFFDYPAITLSESEVKKCKNGASCRVRCTENGKYRCYGTDGEFIMLGSVTDGMIKTIKSFFEV